MRSNTGPPSSMSIGSFAGIVVIEVGFRGGPALRSTTYDVALPFALPKGREVMLPGKLGTE
jgi:hypothetical protein